MSKTMTIKKSSDLFFLPVDYVLSQKMVISNIDFM